MYKRQVINGAPLGSTIEMLEEVPVKTPRGDSEGIYVLYDIGCQATVFDVSLQPLCKKVRTKLEGSHQPSITLRLGESPEADVAN